MKWFDPQFPGDFIVPMSGRVRAESDTSSAYSGSDTMGSSAQTCSSENEDVDLSGNLKYTFIRLFGIEIFSFSVQVSSRQMSTPMKRRKKTIWKDWM
jgi:hypothetical protein